MAEDQGDTGGLGDAGGVGDSQSSTGSSRPSPAAPDPADDSTATRPTALPVLPATVAVAAGPTEVTVSSRTVLRAALVVVGVAALVSLLLFVLEDGGGVIFTLLVSWFASIAMEPAVLRLSRRMHRGVATMIVMLGVIVFVVVFMALFGRLIADQVVQAAQSLPGLLEAGLDWVNNRFGTNYTSQSALDAIGLTPGRITQLAQQLAASALGVVASVLSAVFGVFTFLLFTFYLSADAPRLRRWISQLVPPRQQGVVVTVWELAVQKTGGYVAARVVLAAINGGTTAIFLLIIGMPYWLVLGIWTGIVAQFVPTIGTYIAIILPALVGLLGDSPIQGVLALAWGIAYQQVENLTIEPQISAKAVDVHPAVSFASVMFGAALFGVTGALLAVPVAAMLLALVEIYGKRYELIPEIDADPPSAPEPAG